MSTSHHLFKDSKNIKQINGLASDTNCSENNFFDKNNLMIFIPVVLFCFLVIPFVQYYIKYDTLHLSDLLERIILSLIPCCVTLLFSYLIVYSVNV